MRGAVPLARDPGYCRNCLAKQQVIDRLTEEIQRLKSKLHRQERTAREEPFGESTPSSKRLVKISSTPEARSRIGGAKPGHQGHGRSSVCYADADEIERLDAQECCPQCGGQLVEWGERTRTVHDCEPIRRKTRLVRIAEAHCPCCRKTFRRKPSDVLPRSNCSNRLVAQAAVWHYVDGLTMGHVSRQLDISTATLTGRMHALASILEPAVKVLIDDYRKAPVKHADETGWRCDGANGYTWGFFTQNISIFCCRHTRSGAVAREILGEGVPGQDTLIVDRYGGYNKYTGDIQYCYEHLKRDTQKIVKDNPGDHECAAFDEQFTPLLRDAMRLRNQAQDQESFRTRADEIKAAIKTCVDKTARHPSIQHIQNIFREQEHRLFHWAESPDIPAENNRAERELRPLVIARKTSFGSQSEKGLKTRETLMSVLNTLAKRTDNVVTAISSALDALVANPLIDVADHLLARPGKPDG
jgi:transposase